MDIFIGVIACGVLVGLGVFALLFLMRIWDYLGGKKNNRGKED